MSPKRILIAHDLSETSEEALRVAAETSRRDGASLTILHVYALPIVPLPEGVAMPHPAALVEIQQGMQDALDALKEKASAMGASMVTTDATTGAAAATIVEVARAGGYDLIVMGTHGRRGVHRMLLGSVAEAVVRRAPCPVLTVHPPLPEKLPRQAPTAM